MRARWILFILAACALALGGCKQETVYPDAPREGVEGASDVNTELGLRYMRQGDYELAMEKLERALSQDSNNPRANHFMAELQRRLGEYDKAKQYFQRAVRLAPEDSALQNNYGAFLCSRGEYQEGERHFLKAIADPLYDGKAQAYENAGLCARQQGDDAKAEKYLLAGLRLNARLPKSLAEMANIAYEQNNYLRARAFLQRYQAIARHTPQTLWLGIRIERQLGDQDAVSSYGLLLKRAFPNSRETKLYLESEGGPAL